MAAQTGVHMIPIWFRPFAKDKKRHKKMDTRERQVGDFKIVAKAYPAAQGGFIAAVDIQRVRPEMLPHVDVVYSNGKLFRGHQFEDAHSALVRAMDVGHQMIRGLITVAA
jgi:hypothetical protein